MIMNNRESLHSKKPRVRATHSRDCKY